MAACTYVCESEVGWQRVGIDLTGVFKDEVQQTACQLDEKSVFCVCMDSYVCACVRVCVSVGGWV